MKIQLITSLIFANNVFRTCHAQEELGSRSSTDEDLSFMVELESNYEASFSTAMATRKKFSRHQKTRAKEEIVKATVNACEPDYLLWPDSPEASYPIFKPIGTCTWPHTDENCFLMVCNCKIPDIPSCTGPDRYFYTPPIGFVPVIPLPILPPVFKFGFDLFFGKNAKPACRPHCSGYQSEWCPGFGGMPYCTTSEEDCFQLNWDQYTAVFGFISNFLPAGKVVGIMNKAGKIAKKTERLAFISKNIKYLAKSQLKKMKRQAMKNLKSEIKGLANDLKDELLDVAMEELLFEQAQKENEGLDWSEVTENFFRAIDVVGIFDLTDSFWKEECSVFEPEEIDNEPETQKCADKQGAVSSPYGVDEYWNSHDWKELCSVSKSNWRKLGWNKKKWDGPVVGYPRTVYQSYNILREKQRQAVLALGYRKHQWDSAKAYQTGTADASSSEALAKEEQLDEL